MLNILTSKEEVEGGEGEATEDDAGEDDEEGAPEEPTPRNDVAAALPPLLHRLSSQPSPSPRRSVLMWRGPESLANLNPFFHPFSSGPYSKPPRKICTERNGENSARQRRERTWVADESDGERDGKDDALLFRPFMSVYLRSLSPLGGGLRFPVLTSIMGVEACRPIASRHVTGQQFSLNLLFFWRKNWWAFLIGLTDFIACLSRFYHPCHGKILVEMETKKIDKKII